MEYTDMAEKRISHARGRGSLRHNNRTNVKGNVDQSRSHLNVYYMKEDIDEAYIKCFGQALVDYNEKQNRTDRMIYDYYEHLFGFASKLAPATASNKEQSFYEIVIGIGDMNTCGIETPDGDLAAKILGEYARSFQERNPNLYVFNSVLHMDEKTPHLHIDYIPVAHGYKNGTHTRNSQSKALEQQGFGRNKNSINAWRIRERQAIRELCQQYGVEVAEEKTGRGKTFTPDEYKKIRDEVKSELRDDPDIVDELKHELRTDMADELATEKAKLDADVAAAKMAAQENIVEEKQKASAEISKVKKEAAGAIKEIGRTGAPLSLSELRKLSADTKPSNFTGSLSKNPTVTILQSVFKKLMAMATTIATITKERDDANIRARNNYLAHQDAMKGTKKERRPHPEFPYPQAAPNRRCA
jgi:hypothetical protein